MGIAIGADSLFSLSANMAGDTSRVDGLEEKLKKSAATDEELMEACKSFESYMLEQVFKAMEKTVPETEDKGPYVEQFGDRLYEEYSKQATQGSGFGIAQMLYDSMKRNTNG